MSSYDYREQAWKYVKMRKIMCILKNPRPKTKPLCAVGSGGHKLTFGVNSDTPATTSSATFASSSFFSCFRSVAK